MKLGELKNAIRHRKGNPDVYVSLAGGDKVPVTVQKTALLKALDERFTGGRNSETGLWLDDDGRIIEEGAAPVSGNAHAAEASEEIELDDIDDLDAAEALGVDEIDEL